MGKIYVSQNQLRFTATTGVDITAATTIQIKYIKPDDSASFWTATIEDALTGVIYYDVVDTDEIDQAGPWLLWAFVTFSDGRSAPGEPYEITVFEEGK